MSRRTPEQKQRGFTLIEMMISLLLGSIAAIALTMITRAMTQTAENEKMVVEASQMARSGIDMLRFDFMRTSMFYAANPRHKDPSDTDDTYSGNPNSLVSSEGSGGGTHRAFLRNPIVHLNPDTTGPDTIILVGNFVGDEMYEGEVDADANTITIYTPMPQGQCTQEFDGRYAFAHLVNATGQTHEVKVSAAQSPEETECDAGVCDVCIIHIVNGEIIRDAFGERNVKVGANQAVMYRVETIDTNRKVLMRYFIDYDTQTSAAIKADPASAITDFAATTAVVIAENVVDFQVWFRAIAPGSTGTESPQPVADQAYYPTFSGGGASLPASHNVIVNDSNAVGTASVHLPMPEFSNIDSNAVFPEHVRSAIISLAVRTEKTDQEMAKGAADTDTVGAVYSDELAAPPSNDVGRYRVRRFTVEVKLPNIQSQMALFQASTNLSY
ncbi:MAG: type II secretion system protein [Deltaproteobacteria bacterium]|nr:type II secretion system protein [Deltaproteobacteria bacterium]